MSLITHSTNLRNSLQLSLLLLSLWVGPIPVGHSHAGVLHSSASDIELELHLLHHHQGPTWCQNGCEWHVHWVLRGSSYVGINGETAVVHAKSFWMPPADDFDSLRTDKLQSTLFSAALFDELAILTNRPLAGANWLSGQSLVRISSPTFSSVMRC